MLSGIIHLFYWVFLCVSYKYGDLSVMYPIARSAPVFVPIFAVLFLGERISLVGVLGIASVVLGTYFLPMEKLKIENLVRSFIHFKSKAIFFALLTALTVTAYSLIDKVGAQYVHPVLYVWLFEVISLLLLTPTVMLLRSEIWREWSNNRLAVIFSGFLVLFSYSIIIFVMKLAQVSYIVSVRHVSVVFGVILGGFLKEKSIGIRLFSSTLIFIGLLLISIA